jgi:hypothetical protein
MSPELAIALIAALFSAWQVHLSRRALFKKNRSSNVDEDAVNVTTAHGALFKKTLAS